MRISWRPPSPAGVVLVASIGDTATITYTVTVNNPDTGDKRLVNFVTSTDPGSTCPSDSPAPGCTVTVTDLIPALTITKTANTAAAVPGSTVGYTITVHDTGQTPYTGATVTDCPDRRPGRRRLQPRRRRRHAAQSATPART